MWTSQHDLSNRPRTQNLDILKSRIQMRVHFFCRACVYVPLFYLLSMFVLLHFIIVCPLYRAPVHTQSTWHCIATLFYCSFLVANCSPTLTLTVRYTHLPDKSINQGYTLNYWDKWAASYRYHLINILLFLWIDSYLLR